jgi:arylformamidase
MTFTLLSHEGSHLDAPGRLLRDGARVDQIPLDRLCGPAQIWDLRWHDRNTPLQINDLSQQPTIRPGHVLLLFTGYTPPADEDWPVYTWLTPQAANWLAAQPIRALATDMPNIGSFEQSWKLLEKDRQPEEVWAERLAFFRAGIPVIEGLTNLDQLLRADSMMFVGFPLAISDRSGAPMRAAALLY